MPAEENAVPEAVMRQISPIVGRYKDKPEMLMRMLLEIQEVSGNAISQNVAAYVSRATGIPIAKIFDFTHFYSMFSDDQRGRYIIKLCDSAPCHVCGSANVANAFLAALGLSQPGQTTGDGLFTFELCECLGVCNAAPAAIVGDKVYGNLDEAAAKQLVADLRQGAGK